MKFIKYKFDNKTARKMISLRVNNYNSKDKRNYRICSFMKKFCVILFFIIAITYGISMNLLTPLITNNVIKTIIIVFIVILFFPICGLLSVAPYALVSKLFPHGELPKITNEMINMATKELKENYKITNNYHCTKCFYSSNKKIINKDVLIFIYEDKIRIVNDFFHSIKDFGCYEMSHEEIKVYNEVDGKFVYTVIESKDVIFHFGKTTRNFINKNFYITK